VLPNRRIHKGYFRDDFPTVISALGYLWGGDKIQFYLRVKSLPVENPKSPSGPILNPTGGCRCFDDPVGLKLARLGWVCLCVFCVGPLGALWVPCGPLVGALPSGGLPPFGVPPPVLTDSLQARRAALRTAHAQRWGILAKVYIMECGAEAAFE